MTNAFINSSSIKKLLFSKQRHIHIIGFYFDYKQIKFDNQLQIDAQMRRLLRPAKDLVGYDDDRLEATFKYLDKETNCDKDWLWGLETVLKKIDFIK